MVSSNMCYYGTFLLSCCSFLCATPHNFIIVNIVRKLFGFAYKVTVNSEHDNKERELKKVIKQLQVLLHYTVLRIYCLLLFDFFFIIIINQLLQLIKLPKK